ncbi:MAG TPA: hypothetical protein VND64_23260 [Pirellulales bacterium]|nr:hypothetical protein [Pirellulales bacterium]
MNREEDPLRMSVTKSTIALDFEIVLGFDRRRETLLSVEFADRLDKPLGYWALPTDRQLPLVLMHRPLRELLATPFAELYSTAGIGPKKIRTLVVLLGRACQPQPPGAIAPPPAPLESSVTPSSFEAAEIVSEALWEQWRATAREHALEGEPLGRFASSLRELPRVLWNTPLGAYTEITLTDLRGLRTHGVKRVAAVLEVFRGLHAMLVYVPPQPRLVARVVPRFAAQIESWLARRIPRPTAVSTEEIRSEIIAPLLEQIRLDVGELGAEVALVRLDSEETNVQQTAHRLRTTRSRVYETAAETAAALAVRWPEGRTLLKNFNQQLVGGSTDGEVVDLVDSLSRLFLPVARTEPDETLTTGDSRATAVASMRGQSGMANRNGSLAAGRA